MQVLGAETVGLELVLAAVAADDAGADSLAEVGQVRIAGGRADQHAEQRGRDLARLLAHRVTRGDVADLVAEHAGQLGLGIEVGQDAAGNVDVAAGQRERVDLGRIEHRETVIQLGTMALPRQLLAQSIDVFLQRGVVVDAVLLEDGGVEATALLDFFTFGYEREILFPRHRVGRASVDRAEQQEQGDDGFVHGSIIQRHSARFKTKKRGATAPPLSRWLSTCRSAGETCRPAWRFAGCAACRCRTGATGSKSRAAAAGTRCRLPT